MRCGQLLDDFLSLAAKRTRVAKGANEIAEAMEQLAPSVAEVLDQGTATVSAAKVPGLRFFAAKKGNSKVVLAARNAIKLLDAAEQGFSRNGMLLALSYCQPVLLLVAEQIWAILLVFPLDGCL